MYLRIANTFIIGYLFIAFEHNTHIDKVAVAMLTVILCWVFLVLGWDSIFTTEFEPAYLNEVVVEHIGEIA